MYWGECPDSCVLLYCLAYQVLHGVTYRYSWCACLPVNPDATNGELKTVQNPNNSGHYTRRFSGHIWSSTRQILHGERRAKNVSKRNFYRKTRVLSTIRFCRNPEIYGRAIAQTVSSRLPTAAARVRARVRSCGICGRQSGTGTGFPCQFAFHGVLPQSSSLIRSGWIEQTVAAVPSGLILTPLRMWKKNPAIFETLKGDRTPENVVLHVHCHSCLHYLPLTCSLNVNNALWWNSFTHNHFRMQLNIININSFFCSAVVTLQKYIMPVLYEGSYSETKSGTLFTARLMHVNENLD
jgi:hypothetical protein